MNFQQYPIASTFRVRVPKEAMITGFAPGHTLQDYVPEVQKHTFDINFIRDFSSFLRDSGGDGLMLTGPTGCGKTTGVMQFCARINWPVRRINGHRDTLVTNIIGTKGLRATKACQ